MRVLVRWGVLGRDGRRREAPNARRGGSFRVSGAAVICLRLFLSLLFLRTEVEVYFAKRTALTVMLG